MKLFDSELQYLSELYQKLGEELVAAGFEGRDPGASSDRILHNREFLSRVEKMNERVFQLALEWEKFQFDLDDASRRKTQQIAEKVRQQAIELSKTVALRGMELESWRTLMERQMAEIQRGEQYLKSVKPVKNNYPKFIDSHG